MGRQPDLFQQSPKRLPDGYLPRNNDPPVLLVLPYILIVEIHEVSDVEGHEAAFFLNGKGQLFAVGFSFSLQILGVNDIKSPLPQRVGQACVDILIQEQFHFHRSPLLSRGMRLNLALPVFDIARLFQVRVDLVLVVKVIGQGGMDLGRGQVTKAV